MFWFVDSSTVFVLPFIMHKARIYSPVFGISVIVRFFISFS